MRYILSFPKSRITCKGEGEGQSIEEKMRKVIESKEPIDNVAPLIYTDRKDGVLPQYDHRTDKWEIARQAKDRISATKIAKAKAIAEQAAKEAAEGKPIGEA